MSVMVGLVGYDLSFGDEDEEWGGDRGERREEK